MQIAAPAFELQYRRAAVAWPSRRLVAELVVPLFEHNSAVGIAAGHRTGADAEHLASGTAAFFASGLQLGVAGAPRIVCFSLARLCLVVAMHKPLAPCLSLTASANCSEEVEMSVGSKASDIEA